jgi:cobalt/nickel transport system permease protein
MDIARIDYWAVSGTSAIHRASFISKILASAFVVASVVISRDIVTLLCLYAALLFVARAAKLPLLTLVFISAFPGLFAMLYAVSQAGQGWEMPALIILKALTAATAMVLLVCTTPFAEVAGFMGRFLPRVVSDGLFMTYRSFFILIKLLDNFLTALKLRGGLQPRHIVRNAGYMSAGIGIMFIRAYEKSQRLYEVMSIRGYAGKLGAARKAAFNGLIDLPYLFAASYFLVLAICQAYAGGDAGLTFLPAAACGTATSAAIMEVLRWKI